jgi:hypothetical protein
MRKVRDALIGEWAALLIGGVVVIAAAVTLYFVLPRDENEHVSAEGIMAATALFMVGFAITGAGIIGVIGHLLRNDDISTPTYIDPPANSPPTKDNIIRGKGPPEKSDVLVVGDLGTQTYRGVAWSGQTKENGAIFVDGPFCLEDKMRLRFRRFRESRLPLESDWVGNEPLMGILQCPSCSATYTLIASNSVFPVSKVRLGKVRDEVLDGFENMPDD